MASKIAFQPMRYASFTLYTDCLHECNQSPLNVIGQNYLDYKWTKKGNQNASTTKVLSLACIFCIPIPLQRLQSNRVEAFMYPLSTGR